MEERESLGAAGKVPSACDSRRCSERVNLGLWLTGVGVAGRLLCEVWRACRNVRDWAALAGASSQRHSGAAGSVREEHGTSVGTRSDFSHLVVVSFDRFLNRKKE